MKWRIFFRTNTGGLYSSSSYFSWCKKCLLMRKNPQFIFLNSTKLKRVGSTLMDKTIISCKYHMKYKSLKWKNTFFARAAIIHLSYSGKATVTTRLTPAVLFSLQNNPLVFAETLCLIKLAGREPRLFALLLSSAAPNTLPPSHTWRARWRREQQLRETHKDRLSLCRHIRAACRLSCVQAENYDI